MTETIKARGLVFGDELEAKLVFEKKPSDAVRIDTKQFVSPESDEALTRFVSIRLGLEAAQAIETGSRSLAKRLLSEMKGRWGGFISETQGIEFNPATPSKSVEALVEAAKTDPTLKELLGKLTALANGWERGMIDRATGTAVGTDDDYSTVKVLVPVMRVLQAELSYEGLEWYLKRTLSFYYLKEHGRVKPEKGTKWSPKPLSLSQIEEILTILGKE